MFLWLKRNDRYYLDPETFDRIPASLFCDSIESYGYVDLILTVAAIKHKAWKLLSRRGLDHRDAFLRDFPDAREVYERAVWDSHTSLSAKARGMTVNEMLRMRLGVS